MRMLFVPSWLATAIVACLTTSIGIRVMCAEETSTKLSFVDLQPVANQELRDTLSENFPDANLADLPQGEQKLGSSTYKIGPRFICLGSTLKQNPAKVEIAAKLRFKSLLILHGTQFGGTDEGTPTHVKDGTTIGQYMIRYADGSGESIPVVYGEDVRDWWNWDKSKDTKRGKVVWTGTNPAAKMYDLDLRLFESSWSNPKPELEVVAIEYSSLMDSPGVPFCVAITALKE